MSKYFYLRGEGDSKKNYVNNYNRQKTIEVDPFTLVYRGECEYLEKLIENGKVQIDTRNNKGQTLLHYAMLYNQIEIAKMLVSLGINYKLLDNDGLSIADVLKNFNPEVIKDFDDIILNQPLKVETTGENINEWCGCCNIF